jgi:hypothetical protein
MRVDELCASAAVFTRLCCCLPCLRLSYDKNTVMNHDWTIAHRGFFFDLSPWADAAPDDDPHQPLGSDLAAFKYMLAAAYDATQSGSAPEPIGIHGFTPWAYK